MVALSFPRWIFFYVTSVLLCGQVCAVFPSAQHFLLDLMSAAVRTLPVHPGQACSRADGMKWGNAVRRAIPADWSKLLSGGTPRTLLQYRALTVPSALVYAAPGADPAANPGVTASQVSARDLKIQEVVDKNTALAASSDAHRAEIQNDFFVALEVALFDVAPLLLERMRTAFPLTYNVDMHDGPAAFTAIVTKYTPGAISHVEATTHDDVCLSCA